MKWLRMAWRLLARDRSSGEWRVLLLALVIGVGSVSTTGFLGDRLARAMDERGGEFLGADVQIASPRPMDTLDAGGLQRSESVDFSSMLAFGDNFQLAGVRAVDAAYPLRGKVVIAESAAATGTARSAQPEPGEIFVDGQLLPLLSAQVGDTVEIGVAAFRIAGVVVEEPGRAGAVFGFAPRVFMRRDEVEKTRVIQPGSRVTYLYQFAGEPAAVSAFAKAVKPTLETSQRLSGGRDGNEAVSGAFSRSERFIGLASLVSLLLSAVAVALAARRHAARHFDQAALLRCFGVTSGQLRSIYITQLLSIGLLGSVLGVVVGAIAHQGLLQSLVPQLADRLPTLGWVPIVAGIGSGMLALFGAAAPSLLRLTRVPPLRVLRRDLDPIPLSGWLTVLLSGASLVALCAWYAGSLKLVGYFVAGLAVLALVLALLSQLALGLGRIVQRMAQGPLRFGLAQLLRHRLASTVQLGAFTLALFLMASVALIRTDLIDSWRAQLPPEAPNHFLVNISPDQNPEVVKFLSDEKLKATQSYPMIRGRIISKDGTPIMDAVPPAGREYNAIRRELNLTWSTQLPDKNTLTAGSWHGDASDAQISVESVMAKTLALEIGDTLGFKIGEQQVTARITSIRDVKWDSMQPNFYVIFSPGVLSEATASYITAVHVPAARKSVMASFVKQFPTVTLIAVDKIIADIEAVVAQVVAAIELLLAFLLLSGVAVLVAALLASLDERRQEAVMLRTLGARQAFVRVSLWSEFLVLGALAGLLAAALTEAAMYQVAQEMFELEPKFHPWLWWLVPGAGALLVAGSGWAATRRITRVTPLQALRAMA